MESSPAPLSKIAETSSKGNQEKWLDRAEQNVSQQEAADFLKISRSTYVYYETGRIIPDIAKLCQLSSLFQVSVLEFFPSVPEN